MENQYKEKRLYRSRDRVLGGVLSGFAKYINADPSIIRVAYVLLSVLSAAFPGILVYVIFWIVVPEEPVASN
ncbi:MAG: PspC domain-containing protein [Prolixibacteraceae bacterium]|nr:PspC domain-containing protein [Prolixibacteraceae bacterium]MBN2774061.1 PspC domain-containing protein [Prolixibacteraceae bacterium]